ncbi:MAG: DUF5320 domain-containing protein [Chloroflexota bacterium]|nr:DUF5320 domain-containing protein [Chloroflexota bacterium]
MPAGDGTGPAGMGPMTGRRAGYCAGHDAPGYANPMPGRDFGMGWGRGRAWGGRWGRGRGWRHRYYATGVPGWVRFGYAPAWGASPAAPYGPYAAPPTTEQETEFLKAQAEGLKEQLDAISQRITELEQEK